jgi:hypothetical protein
MSQKKIHAEIERLSQKIRNNTATLSEYQRYEQLLVDNGLPLNFVRSSLEKSGYRSWEELIRIRKDETRDRYRETDTIGWLIGFGKSILLYDKLQRDFGA